jgi:hypothetical protein
MIDTFEHAAADFARFAVKQDYPPNLLWVKSTDAVFAKWNGKWTYFVWKGDPTERQDRAKVEYDTAISRKVAIAFEGKCKTDRWTICRVYVPVDDTDTQYRMIPQTGVKVTVAVEPLPAVLVDSKLVWWILKWITRKPNRHAARKSSGLPR